MRTRPALPLFALAAITFWLTACGGSGGSGGSNPPPPPAISVALSGTPPTSLATGTTTSLTAVVTNDSKSAGVTWSVTCGSAQCGSFAPASTASAAATTYTPPATPPSPVTVTVTATSVTDTAKTATAIISITLGIPASGTYVYHFSGEDANGPVFVAGAFTVLNGAITGGEQDFTDPLNAYPNNLVASTSTLTVAADGNLQIVLDTGNTNIGVNGLETLRGTPVSTSRILISEFDAFASGSGSIDLQTGTAAPSGGYAFNLLGLDSSGVPLAIGGILNISGTSLSVANSVLDYNDGAAVGQALSFTSGSVTAPDSFGRLTFTLTPNTTAIVGFALNGYIVGPNRIQLVEALGDPLNGDLGGTALGQGSNTGNFTAANVGTTTYVFASTGADGSGNLEIAAVLNLNSGGSVSGVLALNDLTNFGSLAITAGTYTVDPTGRVTISNVTPSLVATVPFVFQLYLDGNGNALELGVDKSQLSAGLAYQQTNGLSASFAGAYALSGQGFGVLTSTEPGWSAAGPATIASTSSAVTGFTDYTVQTVQTVNGAPAIVGATPTSNVSLTGTETSGTGILALAGLNAASSTTSNSYAYIPIDTSRVLAIEIDGAQLGLLQLEAITP
jgi:hypothetical protein